jgi:VWFA-related protein
MSVVRRGWLVALAALVSAAAAATATQPPQLVEAGGAAYPEKAYILSLPTKESLGPASVRVTENGVPVQGVHVIHQGTAGSQTAVVLAIDASASMQGTAIQDAVSAARAFVSHMTPGEQVAIVTFNNKVNVLQSFTNDKAKVTSALEQLPKLAVGTKIYDALDQSAKMVSDTGLANGAVVLLSDGTDVGSSATRSQVLKELRSQHVRVFSVGLVSPQFNRKGLEGMAAGSRGQFAAASNPSELAPIYATLGQRLAREYLIQYVSRQNPSKKVNVAVAVKGLPTVKTAYTTPALHIVPAKPYQPSSSQRVIQSPYTAVVVALLAALLLGYAVVHAFASKPDPLVSRVGGFVSVAGAAEVPEAGTRAKGSRGARRSSRG